MAKGLDATGSSSAAGWTSTQAYVMAVICLVIGLAVGYLLRGSGGNESQAVAANAAAPAIPPGTAQQPVTPQQLKQMADTEAAPLLDKLKSAPNDASLLANLGNLYYDAQQFREAIAYYQRALKIEPANTNLRTDMGTALWYLGDADSAIEQFNIVLKTEPNKANTLMNLGIVQWQGKMNTKAAVAAWEKLLLENPNYENKSQVQQLIARAKMHADIKPGTKTDKPAM